MFISVYNTVHLFKIEKHLFLVG